MKRVNKVSWPYLWVFVVLTLLNISGCYLRAAKTDQPAQDKKAIQQSSLISVDNGSTYVNKEGWGLPDLSQFKETKPISLDAKTKTGEKVTIKSTDYDSIPSAEVITEEPFKLISDSIGRPKESLGPVGIYSVRVYEKNNRKFAYRLQVMRVFLDENKKIVERGGAVFFFTYYDQDGDSIFETVALDERSKGITSFQDPPILPDWVLSKS